MNESKSIFETDTSIKFKKLIFSLRGKKVLVIGHVRQDGDCIGAQVALCRCLNAIGAHAQITYDDPIPRVLKPFVGDTPTLSVGDIPNDAFVPITVDCAEAFRCGKTISQRFPTIFLNIDHHHLSNPGYAVHNLVENEAATCAMLAKYFFEGGFPIDKISAQALLLGIAMDTGRFLYPATTADTFSLAAKLVRLGANPAMIDNLVFNNDSIGRIRLLQRFLSSLQMEFNSNVCIGRLSSRDYKEAGAIREDSEGFVTYTRSIQGVKVGVFLDDSLGFLKASLRTDNPAYKVNDFAKQFGGGGHICAAAFNIQQDIDSFYPTLIEKLAEHFKQHNLPVS
ncbi:MAG: hypothetical protein A2007_01340 [Verrucomicrobia bacterium GWC2_42_7]|nr:MAG: hypothetical protein A2007_01340 [Verrucomicrobia bacterium GWC2_42_7]